MFLYVYMREIETEIGRDREIREMCVNSGTCIPPGMWGSKGNLFGVGSLLQLLKLSRGSLVYAVAAVFYQIAYFRLADLHASRLFSCLDLPCGHRSGVLRCSWLLCEFRGSNSTIFISFSLLKKKKFLFCISFFSWQL